MVKSKIEYNRIEIDWNKSIIVKNFKTELILLVFKHESEVAINFENKNNLFSGIVINKGNTNYKIGTILTQQKRLNYHFYGEKIILQNEIL